MDIKPVIVSALFDINRDTWSNFTMSYHTYITWAKYLLSMNTPMVFFTEEKFKKNILETRMLYDPNLEQTKIIIKEKEELELYKSHYHRVKELMESDKFAKIVQFNDVPEMCQPWYNIIMYSKLSLMQEVFEKQYLPCNSLIWKDAAVYREGEYSDTKWPNPNKINPIRPQFFSHHDKVNILVNKDHLLSQTRFIQGGSIVVPGYIIKDLNKKYLKLVDHYLEQGYIGSDEKYLDLLVKENPLAYKLIKVDWRKYKEPLA